MFISEGNAEFKLNLVKMRSFFSPNFTALQISQNMCSHRSLLKSVYLFGLFFVSIFPQMCDNPGLSHRAKGGTWTKVHWECVPVRSPIILELWWDSPLERLQVFPPELVKFCREGSSSFFGAEYNPPYQHPGV